jgi:hypothetical protein
MRRKRGRRRRPFDAPFYPALPVAFVCAAALIVGVTAWHAPGHAALALGLIALGLPAYRYWSRRERSS